MSSNMKLGTKFEPKKILLYLSVLSSALWFKRQRIGTLPTYGREKSVGGTKKKEERYEE